MHEGRKHYWFIDHDIYRIETEGMIYQLEMKYITVTARQLYCHDMNEHLLSSGKFKTHTEKRIYKANFRGFGLDYYILEEDGYGETNYTSI